MNEAVADERFLKLGELLVHSGVLKSGDVVEAAQVSRRLKVPIGRVLIASGCIREDLLKAALEAQMLLRDERVELEMASAALHQVFSRETSFEEALFELKWIGSYNGEMGNLAELLLDSNIVTEEQLEIARNTSSSNLLPLGSALVLEGILSPKFFPTIMQIQEKVIAGEISRRDATASLKAAFMLWVKAEESFTGGDGLPKPRRANDTLKFSPAPAPDIRELPSFNLTMDSDLTPVPAPIRAPEALTFVDLLTRSGVVQSYQVEEAMAQLKSDPELIGSLLMALEVIDESTYKCGVRSHNLLKKHLINSEQAVQMVRQAQRDERSKTDSGEQPFGKSEEDVEFAKGASKRKRTIGGALLAASIAGLAAAALSSKRR
ncbi:MAG TPA: hypothetical protein V6C81_03890 [Planktothrix sp.]|jgi:hypothetical protein